MKKSKSTGIIIVLACLAALSWWSANEAEAKLESLRKEHRVIVVSDNDFAAILTTEVAAASVTTCTYALLTKSSATRCYNAEWVAIDCRFNATTDVVTVQPIFYDSDNAIIRVGDQANIVAGTLLDSDGYYLSEGTEWWETAGAYQVKWNFVAVTGTVKVAYAGTR